MKNKLISNLALMALAVLMPLTSLTSCSDSGRVESFMWPHVSEEVDALSYKLDSMYFHRVPVTELESVLDSLRTAAAKCPRSDELNGRLSYFWAIVANRHPGPNSTLDTIIAVRENIDSAKHQYLFNRASQIIDQTLPVSLSTYDKTLAHIRYFEEIQGTYLTAEHYMNLGVLLKNVKDYDAALRAFAVADSLFMLSGYSDMAAQNMSNVSNVYFWLGDSVKSVQLAHRAALDSTVRANRARIGAIWFNLAIHFDDEAALDSMLSVGFRQHPARQYGLRAKRSYRHGDYAQAVAYADTAIFLAKRKNDLHGLWYAYKAGAPALAHLGRDGQAYEWLNRALAIRDSVDKIEDHENVQILETGRQIATRRMEHELERSRRTLVWVCVAFGVFLILVAAAWIVALRMRRLK